MNGHRRWSPADAREPLKRDADLLSLVNGEVDLQRMFTAVLPSGDMHGLSVWGIAAVLPQPNADIAAGPRAPAAERTTSLSRGVEALCSSQRQSAVRADPHRCRSPKGMSATDGIRTRAGGLKARPRPALCSPAWTTQVVSERTPSSYVS